MEIKNGIIIYLFKTKKYKVSFGLEGSVSGNGLTIKTELNNTGNGKIYTLNLIPEDKIKIIDLHLIADINVNADDRIFLNGYQTWTESREFRPDENMPGLSVLLKPLHNRYQLKYFGDYSFSKYSGAKGDFHGYTYTYIRDKKDHFTLLGSLSERSGFTIFQYIIRKKRLYIVKECAGLEIKEAYKAFEILIAEGNEKDVFNSYFKSMNIKKTAAKIASGWTSWYNYFTKITEEIILENLKFFKDKNVPIDIFQIDDGYQKAVGDWEANNKFPHGMKMIAEEIKKAGFKAGLWLAPFICEEKSDIFNNHKDWILRDNKGKLVLAGTNSNWSWNFYALDIYNTEFRNYLKKVFKTVLTDWGFDLVKLDFLYAACLIPRSDKSRGQVMAEGMDLLRELTGNKLILGCGVPLAQAFGFVDYCRIGSDVSQDWEYKDAALVNYRERVSTINTLKSTIGRRHLSGEVFNNDTDVFILRSENTTLTKEQKRSLFLINLIFGRLIFTSDNINRYSDEEQKIYFSQFPIKDKIIKSVKTLDAIYNWHNSGSIKKLIFGIKPYSNVYQIEFEIEDKEYIAYTNLGNKKISFVLKEGIYYNNSGDSFMNGGENISLSPYSSICLLKFGGRDFEIAGSTGHIFAGCDISEFKTGKENIVLKSFDNPKRQSAVYIKIPDNYTGFKVNGNFMPSFVEKGITLIKITI